ncbi:hypothetical protein O181_089329 [Austropuccinia psidii MF-1]|uniref:Uncharacterized protein n=1 Tax=Austropuccinia psidii MF-1 TaxID=1389203 RepID=A0A9Q3ITB2_9BASI|nr:hypothetical protein [Austropuccinia psidii MF-1]
MSSSNRHYGYGYSILIDSFSSEELEELLFGYPSSPSKNMGIWNWANNFNSTPSSPPALATLSRASSPSPSLEDIPKATLTFYAFIEGKYDPQLFVPNPLSSFLGEEALKTSSVTASNGHTSPSHPYNLRPRDFTGRVVKTSRHLKQVVFPSTLFPYSDTDLHLSLLLLSINIYCIPLFVLS